MKGTLMTKSPSKEQLEEELRDLRKEFKNLGYPKGYREHLLRDIRKHEDLLEIPEEKRTKI